MSPRTGLASRTTPRRCSGWCSRWPRRSCRLGRRLSISRCIVLSRNQCWTEHDFAMTCSSRSGPCRHLRRSLGRTGSWYERKLHVRHSHSRHPGQPGTTRGRPRCPASWAAPWSTTTSSSTARPQRWSSARCSSRTPGPPATLLSIGTLGVAYVARPLGAVLFGHLGDRFGRSNALLTTPAADGRCDRSSIGCLPTYDQIGIAAPIMLVLLRLLQGLSAGGESPGASSLTIEHAPGRPARVLHQLHHERHHVRDRHSSLVFIPVAALPEDAAADLGMADPVLALDRRHRVACVPAPHAGRTRGLRRDAGEPTTLPKAPIVELFRGHWLHRAAHRGVRTFAMVNTIVNVFALGLRHPGGRDRAAHACSR